METLKEKFGALGEWKKIGEKFDESIVKQINDASCVSAVGEMLARYFGLNITQAEIVENIGVWSNSEALARFLNSKETQSNIQWIGGGWDDETPIGALKWLIANNKIGAMLRRNSPQGHAVFIDGFDESGLVVVKDPDDQTQYRMTIEDFIEILSEVVWRRKK